MNHLKKTWLVILDVLFPPACAVCRRWPEKPQALICQNCQSLFPLNRTLFCSLCRTRYARQRKICHPASKWTLAAATTYDNELLQKLIWKLKYYNQSALARPLGELAANYLRSLDFNFKNYSLMPLPLHREREKERGYNQAQLIADYLAADLSLPIIDGALERIRHSQPQTEMKDWDERKKNISGSFFVRNKEVIAKKNILLIDDVCTSGATLNEAATALKKAGARRVIGLVIAKAG